MKTIPTPVPSRSSGACRKRSALCSVLSLVSGALLWGATPSYGLLISDDVDFTTVYEATVLPNAADPAWGRAGSSGTATIESGALVLETPKSGDRIYRIQNSTGPWNGSTATGSTIEFSLKVDTVDGDAIAATSLYFSTGSVGYLFQFHTDGILYGLVNQGLSATFDTTGEFHRYRITLSPSGVASLYADDNPVALITGYEGQAVATNHIYFGDPGGSVGGKVQWEYIAYTNAGAVAPIPEGRTAGLVLLGGALLIGIGHRMQKRARNQPPATPFPRL